MLRRRPSPQHRLQNFLPNILFPSAERISTRGTWQHHLFWNASLLICVLEPDDFCDFLSKQRKQQQGTSLSCRPSWHSTSFIWTKKCNCSQEVKEGRVKLTCMLSHHHILNLGLSPHLQFKKKKAKINKRLLSCQTLIYSPIGSRYIKLYTFVTI